MRSEVMIAGAYISTTNIKKHGGVANPTKLSEHLFTVEHHACCLHTSTYRICTFDCHIWIQAMHTFKCKTAFYI